MKNNTIWSSIKQFDTMDCGASCLKMVAAYYGRRFNVSQIRQTCALSRNGISLLGISKAAEAIGFRTIGGYLPFDTLTIGTPLP